MGKTFDFRESNLETIPLRFVLLAAFSDAERIYELAVILPELELGERGTAGEEIEDGADQGLLALGELDSRCGFDVCVFDLELAEVCC